MKTALFLFLMQYLQVDSWVLTDINIPDNYDYLCSEWRAEICCRAHGGTNHDLSFRDGDRPPKPLRWGRSVGSSPWDDLQNTAGTQWWRGNVADNYDDLCSKWRAEICGRAHGGTNHMSFRGVSEPTIFTPRLGKRSAGLQNTAADNYDDLCSEWRAEICGRAHGGTNHMSFRGVSEPTIFTPRLGKRSAGLQNTAGAQWWRGNVADNYDDLCSEWAHGGTNHNLSFRDGDRPPKPLRWGKRSVGRPPTKRHDNNLLRTADTSKENLFDNNGGTEKNNLISTNDDENGQINPKIAPIYPGTKWCGPGDVADNYDDLGSEWRADKCCRAHDYCPDVIPGGGTNHNLTNSASYTRLSCECDETFRTCLQNAGTYAAENIGKIYFNALNTKCFRNDYPISNCLKRSWPMKRCLKYSYDTSAQKAYQWFDLPYFR